MATVFHSSTPHRPAAHILGAPYGFMVFLKFPVSLLLTFFVHLRFAAYSSICKAYSNLAVSPSH